MSFPFHEKALPFSRRILPSESCIPPAVLHTGSNCSCIEHRMLLHRTEMSCWTIPPLGTLTSVPPTLALCPLLPKERHSDSLGLAFSTLPSFSLVFYLCYFPCLCLPSLALPWLRPPCFALPCLPFFALLPMQARRCKPGVGNCGQVKGEAGEARAVRGQQMERQSSVVYECETHKLRAK